MADRFITCAVEFLPHDRSCHRVSCCKRRQANETRDLPGQTTVFISFSELRSRIIGIQVLTQMHPKMHARGLAIAPQPSPATKNIVSGLARRRSTFHYHVVVLNRTNKLVQVRMVLIDISQQSIGVL